MIYEFLNNDGIIRSPFTRKKACLAKAYDKGQEKFKSINNDFSNQFVGGITKINGSEVLDGVGIDHFWDQTQQGLVYFRVHPTGAKDLFAVGDGFSPMMSQ